MEENELVELYHGTAGVLGTMITDQEMLRPRRGNKYVYLTTDKSVAMQYSRAWTAWAMEEIPKSDLDIDVKPEGFILKVKIRRDCIEDDPYNPEGEPNQYRVNGTVYLMDDEFETETVDFSELNDEAKRMRAYCYWIGIARATDD